VSRSRRVALADRLAEYDTLVEVGVGRRWDVARTLVNRGCTVTATDIVDRTPPASVAFARDDITAPDRSVYADADAVYALRCPPELHRSLVCLGRSVDAAVRFTTLGTDPPAVPVDPIALPGTTLYVPAGP